MLLASDVVLLVPPVFLFLYVVLNYCIKGEKSVCVLVLGDIGRSPRMQYHALSFVETGFTVDIVGYGGSEPQDGLKNNDCVAIHYLREPPSCLKYCPRLLQYVFKVIWQSFSLMTTLLLIPKCGYILMQNPPCIPSLIVGLVSCIIRGNRLVIDWHNYGYTIMALSLGPRHPLVKFSKWYERCLGKLSYKNLCVTKAMQMDLRDNWNIKATVVYDRPPAMFKEADISAQHKLFTKLAKDYSVFRASQTKEGSCTMFTRQDGTSIQHLPNRPALLVSSTSWTEDEDFSLLLAALDKYEEEVVKKNLPNIICVITGKGPLKEFYREKINATRWQHVKFCLPWLEPEDYPVLLGSADLGVCLHKSSSDLDLPMKVVDMFGCGLPVCAVHFKCLDELVKHQENGLVFDTSEQLSQQIMELLEGFPSKSAKLALFRKNLDEFQSTRWQPCWEKTVLPLFTSDKSKSDDDDNDGDDETKKNR